MPIFKLFSVFAKSIIIQLWNVISFNEELVFLEQNLSSRFLLAIWCWKEHHLQVKYKLNVTNLSIIWKTHPTVSILSPTHIFSASSWNLWATKAQTDKPNRSWSLFVIFLPLNKFSSPQSSWMMYYLPANQKLLLGKC